MTGTADLPAYAARWSEPSSGTSTDGFVQGRGSRWTTSRSTGCRSARPRPTTEGWTPNGFSTTTGALTTFHDHFYIAEYRPYRDHDTSLATAYNFGFLNTKPDWVEHYPFQDGLLVSYWDTG